MNVQQQLDVQQRGTHICLQCTERAAGCRRVRQLGLQDGSVLPRADTGGQAHPLLTGDYPGLLSI